MQKEQNTNKKEFLICLGKRIKEIRESKGFSQFGLANEAEVVKNQIGRIERGEINTSIFTLRRIADALEVELSDLL